MNALFANGRVLDAILLGMLAEGLGLVMLWSRRRLGIRPMVLLPNLGAGMALLLAMRLALAGAGWLAVAACLLLALLLHLVDLSGRWAKSG